MASRLAAALLGCLTTAAFAQGQPGPPGTQDPRVAAILAQCKTPPVPFGMPPRPPGAQAPAAPRAPAVSKAIPEVIAADQTWKTLWSGTGNNSDGILATEEGDVLFAKNDDSEV